MVIIYPLYQIVEFAYRVFFYVSMNVGIAIIGVSIAVTLLCLPLYAVAEAWQEKERLLQLYLKPDITHIKHAFKGDEQYMLLTTLYRQNHYHPIMALRSSFGLLIQVPFFIAAYKFLSHNSELLGRSFAFINDMGQEDALLHLGNIRLNILPITMTLINIISGVIYSKGHGIREKIQIVSMAAVFLVILYKSPAGLVLYWTMNNVFSLVKNIFYKLHNPIKIFYICVSSAITCCSLYLLTKHFKFVGAVLVLNAFIIMLPLLLKLARKTCASMLKSLCDSGKNSIIFFTSTVAFCLLCGVVIPSLLMTSSPLEYCYLDGVKNPLSFLYNSLLQAVGLFIFWPLCLYFLFSKKIKSIMAVSMAFLLIAGVVNAFIFQGNYGVILPEVIFMEHRSFFPTLAEFCCNMTALILVLIAVYIIFKKSLYKIAEFAITTLLMAAICISVFNTVKIAKVYEKSSPPAMQFNDTKKLIHLSKTAPNVMVLMIDRSTGYIIDKVFERRPELYDKFTGFVKYPNCVSFGSWTIQGAVCLYGGYEYTPWAMNHRRDLPMIDKHNEGISMQTAIFANAGYHCTVFDPPYPNYDRPPVFKAFESFPNTECYQLIGKYNHIWCNEHGITPAPIRSRLIKRNFIWYSIFKVAPMILRSAIHFQEFWAAPKGSGGQDISHFIDNYSVLDYLPRLTECTDSVSPGFFIMDNEICHDQVFTHLPDFTPEQNLTQDRNGKWENTKEFHVNCAAYILLGRYIDYLKANGVYDNTRIIIVADHGANTRMNDLFDKSIGPDDFEKFNPVLMIKDFNAQGRMTSDMTFMTHADTPSMAFTGVIEEPVNPYTGAHIRPLNTEEKNTQTVISFSRANAVNQNENNGYKIRNADWFTVHDDIFHVANWKQEMPNTYIPPPYKK